MMTLRFEGGADLAKALASLSPRLSKPIQRGALREGAEPMRVRMGSLAPRRPPHPDMADHMAIANATGEDTQEIAVAVGPEKRFFYGLFQELGTAFHAAQPFARPAFDAVSHQSLLIIGAALWRELAGKGIGRTVSSSARIVGGPGGGLQ